MEENPLELALQQLAKTMGVNLPVGESNPKSEQNREDSLVAESTHAKITAPNSASEEGELSDEAEPLADNKRAPKKQAKKKSPKKPAPAFTGEVDAESLLRGPTSSAAKTKRPRTEPTSTKSNKGSNKESRERPRVPCRYWMEGKCTKGNDCTFSHANRPNKSVDEAKSEDVCRFHIAGNCLKGDKCMYSHDLSKVPCRFFHVKGDCGAGTSCRFSHSPIGEVERHQLFAEAMGTRDPRLSASTSPSSVSAPSRPSTPPIVQQSSIPVLIRDPTLILDPKVQKHNPYGSPF